MGRHEEKTNPMEEQYLLPSRFTLEFKYSLIVYNGPQYREATLKENYICSIKSNLLSTISFLLGPWNESQRGYFLGKLVEKL